MRAIALLAWALADMSAYLGGVANAASGLVELDLIFPHDNETYAPTENFPLVFAVQNPSLATNLSLKFPFELWNGSTGADNISYPDLTRFGDLELETANLTDSPKLVYAFATLDTEGPYMLATHSSWLWCDRDDVGLNISDVGARFTVKEGGKKVDLVAATASKDGRCSAQSIALINVTGETRELRTNENKNREEATVCAIMPESTPTATPDPCRVQINQSDVESMDAYLHDQKCKVLLVPTDECPDVGSASPGLAIGCTATFAVALAAFGLFLI